MAHTPVLLQEIVDGLKPKTGDTVVDATLGAGGHASALGKKIGATGTLIGIDADERALKNTETLLRNTLSCRMCFILGNFRDIDTVTETCGVQKTDILLFDLGISSMQLEESGRGFSFRKHEPLLMTMREKAEGGLTAYEIVNSWNEESIAKILYEYGEERRARIIAKAIVGARETGLIGYADELAKIVENAVGGRFGKIHPATKTFQALRIAVNDELNALSEGLSKGISSLNNGGRIGVISFHSLEDRIVKQFFKSREQAGIISILTKKPTVPSRTEVTRNPRARSAKLRIAQKF